MSPPSNRSRSGRGGGGRNHNNAQRSFSSGGRRSTGAAGGAGRRNHTNGRRQQQRGNSSGQLSAVVAKPDRSGLPSDMRDEDVLIAFMPYLKGNRHEEATKIHETYGSDQAAFLRSARAFLEQQKQLQGAKTNNSSSSSSSNNTEPAKANTQDKIVAPASLVSSSPHPTLQLSPTAATAPIVSSSERITSSSQTATAPYPVSKTTTQLLSPEAAPLSPMRHASPVAPHAAKLHSTPPPPKLFSHGVEPPRGIASMEMLPPQQQHRHSIPNNLHQSPLPNPLPLASNSPPLQHSSPQPNQYSNPSRQQQQQQQQANYQHHEAAFQMASLEGSLLDSLFPDNRSNGANNSNNAKNLKPNKTSNAIDPMAAFLRPTATTSAGTADATTPPLSSIWGAPTSSQAAAAAAPVERVTQGLTELAFPTPVGSGIPATDPHPPPIDNSISSSPQNFEVVASAPAVATPVHSTWINNPAPVSPATRQQALNQSQRSPGPPSQPGLATTSAQELLLPQQQHEHPVSKTQTPTMIADAKAGSKQQSKQQPQLLAQNPGTPQSAQRNTTANTPPPKIAATPTPTTKREGPGPRRVWTHFEEQPGRIVVDGYNGSDPSLVLPYGPRQELKAFWSVPLSYLQQYTGCGSNNNDRSKTNEDAAWFDQALSKLTVGLFRRGCTENGAQASIISKSVTGDDRRKYDYWKDPATGNLCGRVPFYSPRTPGHVLFRMYWEDKPVYTVATGPQLHIRVREQDFESSIKFILSNFKSKKTNVTSLSSLHSLAGVLETPLNNMASMGRPIFNRDVCARSVWGCLQEARKVVEACATEYSKMSAKLTVIEENVEKLKEQVEDEAEVRELSTSEANENESAKSGPEKKSDSVVMNAKSIEEAESSAEAAGGGGEGGESLPPSALEQELRDKTRALMSGRASCERKWRDSQLAFASILKAVNTNRTLHPLLSSLRQRDVVTKMHIELELWCPLSEEFAIITRPEESDPKNTNDANADATTKVRQILWYESINFGSATLETEIVSARVQMQMRNLAFSPNTLSLEETLFPRKLNRSSGGGYPHQQRVMDPGAVTVFNNLSGAMGQHYQNLHARHEPMVVKQREWIRRRTELAVEQCGVFPAGTRVAIFGSSANGFGSPRSDIDMCLQLPEGTAGMFTKKADASSENENNKGAAAMAKLGEFLKETGMNDVDTSRLTARIPILRYYCPNPLYKEKDNDIDPGNGESPPIKETASQGDEFLHQQWIECDLSMHNPLAVLNTRLLQGYAEITPVTRVLAAIIKRWAKARDINNPARHTLSSYGYMIMLLHFMTFHKRSPNGLISCLAPTEGTRRLTTTTSQRQRQNPRNRSPQQQQSQPLATPLLPNLQWMDPSWPSNRKGTPYRELSELPRTRVVPHPLHDQHQQQNSSTTSTPGYPPPQPVNSYFHFPTTPNEKAALQSLFPGQDLSLAILLATFFRYYAYEFDYKRHVVSLHSTAVRGIVEREVKAETDSWKNYSAALTIEDPFETGYDIAHVLRGGYYHRIRREFAVAYSKIADAAAGRAGNWRNPENGVNDEDLRSMSGEKLLDWICEPLNTEA